MRLTAEGHVTTEAEGLPGPDLRGHPGHVLESTLAAQIQDGAPDSREAHMDTDTVQKEMVKMRVLITGQGNATNLARMLSYYGVDVEMLHPIPLRGIPKSMGEFDISLIMGVRWWNIVKSRSLPGKKIYRFQGTDAHQLDWRERNLLKLLDPPILYASEGLRELVGLPGEVIITPIDTKIFNSSEDAGERPRDVLYYCPHGREDTYRLDKLEEYLEAHPGEACTIIGGEVPHVKMPDVYISHKKYLRWTTHDANPKMPYEALLCGCEVWYNDERITDVPDYMIMENSIPKFIRFFEAICR